jgi:predicted kinase
MIILVAGLPGSGKSYFATRLASHLGAVYISSDKVRKSLDGMGKYTLKDKLSVYKGMADLAEASLTKGEKVVLDATFHLKNMRSLIYTLADKHSSDIYFIYIEAGEELIKKRVAKERPDSEADFEVYKKIKGEFEAIDVPHLNLLSTDSNITEMIQEAKHYIYKQR